MKIVAIIQARMNSSRLPNKVLLKINQKTILELVYERLSMAKLVDNIIIATSISKDDDKIVEFAQKSGINFYRGSHDDVLDRYYKAALEYKADLIVRVTADCPLISPDVVDKVIIRYKESNADYALALSRENNPLAYPRGTNVEIFSFKILEEINSLAKSKDHREHVATYLEDNPHKYKIEWVEAEEELRRPEYRLTLDTKEDFRLISTIYNNFPKEEFVSLSKAIQFLDNNPNIQCINWGTKQIEYASLSKKNRHTKIICFRVDASIELGFGHLSRCLSLVNELHKLGYKSIFISKKNLTIDAFIDKKVPVILLPENVTKNEILYFLRNILSEILPLAIILDLITIEHGEYMALKQFSGLMVDINGENFSDAYSDIIVKGDVNARSRQLADVDYLLGTSYKILGSNLSSIKKKAPIPNHEIKNIIVSMGGTDPNNLILDIANALSDQKTFNIKIVISDFFAKEKELLSIINKKKHIKLLKNPKNFKDLLADADVCFISGGITLYEAIYLEVIPMVACQNERQVNDAIAIEDLGLCICLNIDNPSFKNDIKQKLNSLSFDIRSKMIKKCSSFIDGLGAYRVASFIDNKIKQTQYKKLLTIGAGIEQTPIIKTAKSMGCEVIAVDGSSESPGFKFADFSYIIDTKNKSRIKSIADKHEIDAIITSTESGIKTIASIVKKNNLIGVSDCTTKLLTNKEKLKSRLNEQNIATPQGFFVHDYSQVMDAIETLGYPVILKPSDNAGARGVMKVNNPKEVATAYRYAIENTISGVLVEKFLNGHEIGCEAIVLNGKIHHFFLTDKIKTKPPYCVVMGHIMPANISEKLRTDIIQLVNQAVYAIGFKDGPINLDIILTKQGPYIIDMGARLGGNYLPLLVYLSSGINTYKEAIKIALGKKTILKKKIHRYSAIVYLEPTKGKVVVKDQQNIFRNKGLFLFNIKNEPIDYVEEIKHVSHRFANFVVTAPDLNELNNRIFDIKNSVKLKQIN